MAARLKDRQRSIPYGLKFYQPETGWRPRRNQSFTQLVQQLISHRKGNRALLAKHGWSIDPHTVGEEVDAFNANVCIKMGWNDYVITDGEALGPPKSMPQRHGAGAAAGVRHFVSGAQALVEMFGPAQKPVDRGTAEARAAICVGCPHNDQGDWKRHFTEPAALAVRKMLGIVKDLDLRTSVDGQLQICSVCYCPLKTKIWAPLDHIKSHLKPQLQAQLPDFCWIRK